MKDLAYGAILLLKRIFELDPSLKRDVSIEHIESLIATQTFSHHKDHKLELPPDMPFDSLTSISTMKGGAKHNRRTHARIVGKHTP